MIITHDDSLMSAGPLIYGMAPWRNLKCL
jgi:hypothetical protein